MKRNTSQATSPVLISIQCRLAEHGDSYSWHSHPFEEFTLVTDSSTRIGYAAGQRPVHPNTLLLYRQGEQHGAWNTKAQAPRYWVLHFTAPPSLLGQANYLAEKDPTRRVWQLTPDQLETYKWLFLQILNEQAQQRNQHSLAVSSWLNLLLLYVHRWATGDAVSTPPHEVANSELLNLWHVVNSSAEKPVEALRRLRLVPNYDSLRHAFKKSFGCSPREMMSNLRMQHAKNLLLESSLSVKEISSRCGFVRQHEFTRAFHERVGVAPSLWRINPFVKNDTNLKRFPKIRDTTDT
jgi:hypothetical protein